MIIVKVGGAHIALEHDTLPSTAAADMAGVITTITNESLRDGTWYRCADSWPLEPLDILHLLFPNQGRDVTRENVCFVPTPFTFPLFRNFLPDDTDFFHLGDFVDACIALFLLCFLVTIGMIIVKFVWEKVDSRFKNVCPNHKKWYVVANLSKAFFLASMAISTKYWIGSYRIFGFDNFSGLEIKRTGLLYLVTDVVALYMVPKLPMSTILHHVVTTALIMIMTTVNLSLKGWSGLLGVVKMTILYGVFSSVAFCVNAYLALRVVYPHSKGMQVLVHLSLWPYILLCAGNWTIHALWLGGVIMRLDVTIATVLYMFAVGAMVHDDIVLIKWLWKRTSPMASEDKKTD